MVESLFPFRILVGSPHGVARLSCQCSASARRSSAPLLRMSSFSVPQRVVEVKVPHQQVLALRGFFFFFFLNPFACCVSLKLCNTARDCSLGGSRFVSYTEIVLHDCGWSGVATCCYHLALCLLPHTAN